MRRNDVDTDAIHTPFASGATAQGADCFLGRGIMAVARCVPAYRRRGGQVDHRAVALEIGVAGPHQAQGGHGARVDALHEGFVADLEDAA
ncbi:hypothetical protein D3C81_1721030 [compost metagenome]